MQSTTVESRNDPMNVKVIRAYYHYTDWANQRVLTCASKLPNDQFCHSDLEGVWSVRETLVHILWGQEIWLDRWLGLMRGDLWSPEAFPAVDKLITDWDRVTSKTWSFIDTLTDARLAADWSYTNQRGDSFTRPLWQMMLHQANHATYHRGDVASMLTRYGQSPGEIDVLRWVEAMDQSSG
jgi:uncharacterized damage-inducible protein DinB